MSRIRRGVLGVAATLVALLVAGCGGDPVTHGDFGRDAGRLCARANSEAQRVRTSPPEPASDLVDVEVDVTLLVIDVYRETIDDLEGLDAPKSDRAAIEKWLAVLDQMLDEAELAHLAHDAGDAAASDGATERATLLDGRARDLARELAVDDPCRLPSTLRSGSTRDLP